MTEVLFFDTDCLSAFLWVRGESLLTKLYPGRIVVPGQVYAELAYPGVSHLKKRVDNMLTRRELVVWSIPVSSCEFELYHQLTVSPRDGHPLIGKGEAAALVMAKKYDGIIASNNLRDITDYVKEFELRFLTTADILVEALDKQLITIAEGERLWQEMLRKRRKLGAVSFKDHLRHLKRNV